MAQTYPIRMQSPEKTNGERDTFHPETDIDYVLKIDSDGSTTALPKILESMYPLILSNPTTLTGNGEKIVFAATSSDSKPI